MPLARIYLPAPNAMQSGQAKEEWLLEYMPESPYFTDDLMGWTGMKDTIREIRLRFPSKEAAIAYAASKKIAYELELPNPSAQIKKAYADNFSFKKIKI